MRKTYKELYNYWLNSEYTDCNTKSELIDIKTDEKEIEERFYRELQFGTGGMRGIIGAGTNRMNIYTVRRAAKGIADFVLKQNGNNNGVVIGYDTRFNSDIFANECARILIANGILVYMFDTPHSTPEVSFAIRHLNAAGGIIITASHNPKNYNGLKGFGPDGGQFPPEASDMIENVINSYDIFTDIDIISDKDMSDSGLYKKIGDEINEAYLDAVMTQSINKDYIARISGSFKLVYTPFHGVGLRPVTEVLKRIGFKNVLVVSEQAVPDPAFSTVKSPNPEDKEGFNMAIKLAKDNDVDLIIGTDPDADRVGVITKDSHGEYQILSGNQTGSLLCEYILSARYAKGKLTEKSTIVKTVVTSDLPDFIAKNYGVKVVDVLTGFKYIGEKITEFEQTDENTFEFGFEESFGYLAGTHCRDKDSVVTSMLVAEMAAYYKSRKMTLYDALYEIYDKYGYFKEKTVSIVMPGKDGIEKIAAITRTLRENPPDYFGDKKIVKYQDYLTLKQTEADKTVSDINGFPNSDVLKYFMEDRASFMAIRPSGTEPKIKIYICTHAKTENDAEERLSYLLGAIKEHLNL